MPFFPHWNYSKCMLVIEFTISLRKLIELLSSKTLLDHIQILEYYI